MLPDYGISDYIFSVQDFGFATRIAFFLQEQILRYVPLVATVTAKNTVDEDGRAVVALQYTEVGEINAPKNLVFPVWQLVDGGSI